MFKDQRLLVANRGEIAVRIIQSAKQLGITTLAIYTSSDSLSPHVLQADVAIPLPPEPPNPNPQHIFRFLLSYLSRA